MKNSPINKLLFVLDESPRLEYDNWLVSHAFRGLGGAENKKWVGGIVPANLLNRSLKESVNSIMSLAEFGFCEYLPLNITSPNYGDKWGRCANYIEINNRAISQKEGEHSFAGIESLIKLLPAIPPSGRSWVNCVILSQIFPNIYGDGYNKAPWEENSLYGVKLNAGYSANVVNYKIVEEISPEEQLLAFNQLAYLRGLKTGVRIVISEDQIRVARPYKDDEIFRWHNKEHEELFINEIVKLALLGFEAVFIDSGKHVGFYDMENYQGVGAVPDFLKMQYITYEVRSRSGACGFSFVSEKSDDDINRYKKLGYNSGTCFCDIFDEGELKFLSEKFKYCREYAPGYTVSDDNYEGGTPYEERLCKIAAALGGYYYGSDKLASFMQMEDLFPLRYDTSTHHLMLANPSYTQDGSPENHWENLFAKDDGKFYNHLVGEIFAKNLQN